MGDLDGFGLGKIGNWHGYQNRGTILRYGSVKSIRIVYRIENCLNLHRIVRIVSGIVGSYIGSYDPTIPL